MAAKRIQRKRTRGWRKNENTVYVGRPTRWGNPFVVDEKIGMTPMLAQYGYRSNLLLGRLPVMLRDVKRELRGKDLCCWCPLDQPCHADVLLEYANEERER